MASDTTAEALRKDDGSLQRELRKALHHAKFRMEQDKHAAILAQWRAEETIALYRLLKALTPE
jgi:hypothetical protein